MALTLGEYTGYTEGRIDLNGLAELINGTPTEKDILAKQVEFIADASHDFFEGINELDHRVDDHITLRAKVEKILLEPNLTSSQKDFLGNIQSELTYLDVSGRLEAILDNLEFDRREERERIVEESVEVFGHEVGYERK